MCKIESCEFFPPLQALGKLYAVLSDKEQRAVYDEQGVVDEESDVLSQDRCWEDYWRLLFPKVKEHSRCFPYCHLRDLIMSHTHGFVFVLYMYTVM